MHRLQLLLPVVHLLFFILLLGGWWMGELNRRWIFGTLVLWTAGVATSFATATGWLLFGGLVAVLDAVLVLKVFKRDIDSPV